MTMRSATRRVFLLLVASTMWIGVCGIRSSRGADAKAGVDSTEYASYAAQTLKNETALADVFYIHQMDFLPIVPPDFILSQPGTPDILPFDPSGFSKKFLSGLVATNENSVKVYPLTLIQNKAGDTVCLNALGARIYSWPAAKDADPLGYEVELRTKIVSIDDLAYYLFAKDAVEEAAAASVLQPASLSSDGGGIMMDFMRPSDADTNIVFSSIALDTNGILMFVDYPDGFTNGLDIFTCTNLIPLRWALTATNLPTVGTNEISWTETNAYPSSIEGVAYSYAAGNSSQDTDGDGLTDAKEFLIYGTSMSNPDTDGDGFSDGDEVNVYFTDPLDPFSVPPLDALRVSGNFIVGQATNPVVLKSVNIGGWLAFEQWMVAFQPTVFFNSVLKGGTNNMDETTLQEFLVDNTDFATNLYASQQQASNGIDRQTWDGKTIIGSFDYGNWVCFSNVNFGTGVSNLSVIAALGDCCTARTFEIRIDSLGGTIVGTGVVADTGAGWGTFSEHKVSGLSVSSNHDVYFIGKADGVGNIYRFRFYRDTNTRQLLDTFRKSYFTTNDLDNLRSLGYNCIRVPFPYDLIQDGTGKIMTNGWDRLDWVIDECRKRHMWVILDLHGTPGSQNYADHSGQPDGMRSVLWTSQVLKDRTASLWKEVAGRYRTNTTVAGYDLFNEPDSPMNIGTNVITKVASYTNYILPVLTSCYAAVRSTDTTHIVFMESNFLYTNMWGDVFTCPSPASEGWSNVVYEFHHYDRVVYGKTGSDDFTFETQKGIADEIIRTYTRFAKQKQAPVFIGEFMPADMPNYDYFIRQFEASGLSWAQWNFRHWGYDDTNRPWSNWGLDYRTDGGYSVNTTIQPDVKADTLATLTNKLAGYTRANYTPHPQLPQVVRNNAKNTNAASTRTEFYLNTFSGPDVPFLTDPNGWPWKKLAAGGSTNIFNYEIANQRAQLFLAQGPVFVRVKAREEADARFEINDATGCWFSVDSTAFNVTSNQAGYDAAINLCAVRDEITNKTYAYDTEGVIARLEYDLSGNSARITVYGKNGGANTNGTQLQQVSGIGYVSGATLQMFVNQTNVTVNYNGTNIWSGAHGLNLNTWADGAVCVVEAEQVVTNTTQYAEFDNIKVERPSAAKGKTFSDDFSSYATGIVARAEPERLALRRWTNAAAGDSVMTNGALVWIPQSVTNGGSWYGPRRDYQNDVRLDLSGTTVAEVQVTYDSFSSTNFQAKIAMMPEYFAGEISNQYVGTALYLEIALRLPGETNAGNLAFSVWRHTGPGTRTNVAVNDSLTFVSNQVVSFQVSTNWCQVWYGTNLPIDTVHGLTNAAMLYSNGIYPHLELKNRGASVNLIGQIGDVLCRNKGGFGPP